MVGDILRLDLRLRRRSTVAYVLGVGAYALLIVALYPSFRDDTSLDSLTASNPKLAALFGAAGSLTSPDGWMNANLYANFLPLFALLMTIGYGASAIAGQDEDGTLGGVASLPLARPRLLLEKTAALAVLAALIPLVSLMASLAGRAFGLDLGARGLVGVTGATTLMAFDFGLLALMVGAWTGSRGAALGLGTAVAAVAYVISSLAPAVRWVHAVREVSPIYWSVGADQISTGASVADFMLLALLGLALWWLAMAGWQRLDVH